MFESILQIESGPSTQMSKEKGKGTPQTPHSVVPLILRQAECGGKSPFDLDAYMGSSIGATRSRMDQLCKRASTAHFRQHLEL